MMETVFSILIGLGLAAACGFRVFVPLLIMSLASRAGVGQLVLSPNFAWIGSTPALLTFSAATILEIAGYYIPWVDNLLDTIATPTAVIAGILVTASAMTTDVSPFLKWTLAVVAGGGTTAAFQGITSVTRHISSFTTGGSATRCSPPPRRGERPCSPCWRSPCRSSPSCWWWACSTSGSRKYFSGSAARPWRGPPDARRPGTVMRGIALAP